MIHLYWLLMLIYMIMSLYDHVTHSEIKQWSKIFCGVGGRWSSVPWYLVCDIMSTIASCTPNTQYVIVFSGELWILLVVFKYLAPAMAQLGWGGQLPPPPAPPLATGLVGYLLCGSSLIIVTTWYSLPISLGLEIFSSLTILVVNIWSTQHFSQDMCTQHITECFPVHITINSWSD